MKLFSWLRRDSKTESSVPLILPAAHAGQNYPVPLAADPLEWRLYEALRYAVPVIDAALRKIIRLTGGLHLTAESSGAQDLLTAFAEHVPVNASGASLQTFADQMLDSLLMYGNAVGELLVDADGLPCGLLSVKPELLVPVPDSPTHCAFYTRSPDGKQYPVKHPERILFAALDPPAGSVCGVSVLRGLPAISKILLRIFECIAQNYDRAGNVRYAVTYHPDSASAGFAKEHAEQIAAAWKDGIRAAKYGEVQDFVAVGDIDIKVIGAENQLFNTEIPVRQILEQIVSKLSIPPFLLGFSWSTTERMSTQQADILTSELEYFRRLLSPVLRRVGTEYLRACGYADTVTVEWDNINLQDETELADARLKNAQAQEIELRCEQMK
ncbi:MAG: serine/threonine protein phosphatase [Oscillospiraceae bacterium]|nr:serine/threonine protein phosphatase [Oscillospiraceae bacterium]